ncbi:phage antirepressor N-terminal domain-containing protein [Promineifilum sp.]|uniref:phage antirepressor N-terminal domain-containing protein n=1 Tax=Promineifilum sp. TaxID=2664178 RepID=UPI0035AF3385
MSDEATLIPVEQKEVLFYDDQLIAVRGYDGHVYVAIGQLCDLLGMDRASQTRRIRGDEILADGYRGSVNLTYPGGGTQPSGVLRVDLLPLWLTGIRTKAVRPEIRAKLERFKREAAKVLWEAFQEGRLTADPSFDDLLRADTPAAQAYRMAQALLQLARQQLLLEARLVAHDDRLDAHEDRLEQIESALGDRGRFITPEQATEISQAVKSIAAALHKQSGRNEYGAVYGEFYRKFGIPSYRELPARRFDEAIRFLTAWFAELTDQPGLPF